MTRLEGKRIILAENTRMTPAAAATTTNDTSKLLPSKLFKDISTATTATTATTNTTFSTDTNITNCSSSAEEEQEQNTVTCTSSVVYKEIIVLLKLIIPIIIVQICNVCPTIIITSYIGYNYGSLYLQSYTLGISVCNIFVLVIIEGIYRSLETLLPQSYGSYNYNEMQYTVLRAIVCCFIILLPITILLLYNIQSLLLYLNEDVESTMYASYWYSIYSIEVPFNALYQILSCFLSAQHIVLPQSFISIFCSTIVLLLLVHYLCPIYGFIGTSISMVLTTIIQLILLVSYTYIFQPHHPETWSSSKLIIATSTTTITSKLSVLYENIQFWYNTIFDTSKLYYFISLGFGGILASSYWIYWELLSLMIGSMSSSSDNSNNELAIFTIPTQVLNIIFMIPYGIGIGMTIRIGNLLSYYPHRAKLVCYYGTILSIVLYGIISIVTYYYRYSIYNIFTIDPILIHGCEEIWIYVVIYSFNMCLYAMNMGIATSLGQQGFAGCLCILFLHCLILPIVYIKVIRHPHTTNNDDDTTTNNSSLQEVWKIICFAYVPINCILFIKFFFLTNWDTMSQSVRIREGIIPFKVSETVSLSLASYSSSSSRSSSTSSLMNDNYDDNNDDNDYDLERNKENSTTGSNNNNNNQNHELYYQLPVKNKSTYGSI